MSTANQSCRAEMTSPNEHVWNAGHRGPEPHNTAIDKANFFRSHQWRQGAITAGVQMEVVLPPVLCSKVVGDLSRNFNP